VSSHFFILGVDNATGKTVAVDKSVLETRTKLPVAQGAANPAIPEQIVLAGCGDRPMTREGDEVTVLGSCVDVPEGAHAIPTSEQPWNQVIIDLVTATEVADDAATA